jgi:hypothetical protein
MVSVTGLDALVARVGYLVQLTGDRRAAKQLQTGWQELVGGKSVPGIDGRRRAGAFLRDWTSMRPVFFLPLRDAQEFLTFVASKLPVSKQDGTEVFTIAGPRPLYFKPSGRWGYIALESAELGGFLLDPEQFVSPAAREHDVSVSASVASVPQGFRQMLGDVLAQSAASSPFGGSGFGSGAGDAYAAGHLAGEQFARTMVAKNLEEFFRDAGEVTFGLSIEDSRRRAVLESYVSARPGTRLEETIEAFRGPPSRFTALAKSRKALVLVAGVPVVPEAQAAFRELLYAARSASLPSVEEQQREDYQLFLRFCELLEANVGSGRFDFGLTVDVRGDGKLVVAGGAVLVQAAEAQKLVERALGLVSKGGSTTRIADETLRGLKVRAIRDSVVPAGMRRAFGDSPCLRYAFNRDVAYFTLADDAAGRREIEALIDAVAKPMVPSATPRPFELRVQVRPWLELVARDEPQNRRVRSFLEALGSSDATTMAIEAPRGGFRTRLEVEEGILTGLARLVGSDLLRGLPGF